ncbi:MAG: hypothetical protein R3330_15480, partial [Saprospiraceae bacterium]|nr:hypothetical protein [Saprospiraceae bacterium]
MKAIFVKTALTLLTFTMCFQAKAHVELDVPTGGETYDPGDMVVIAWHEVIPHNTLNWDLYFSADGGQEWEILQLDLPVGTHDYTWTVPNINTTQARIMVVQDNEGMDYDDQSPNFTIDGMPPEIQQMASNLALMCSTADQAAQIQQWLDDAGGAVAVSFCGSLTWTNDYTGLTPNCGASGTALVSFTATDSCGNSVVTSASVTVEDNTGPVIMSQAQDMTVVCDGNANTSDLEAWLANHGGAMAGDACSEVTWTYNFQSLDTLCGSTVQAAVIFTATDACGNSSVTSAEFLIQDTIPPVITQDATALSLQCGSPENGMLVQDWLADNGGALAQDACSAVTWTHEFQGLDTICGSSLQTVYR